MSAVGEAPPEPDETFTEADILEVVRELAADRDPWRRLPYDTASPARIKHAAVTAQRLIETHLRYLRHYPRGRGRRQHNAEIFRLLDQTNPATLTMALAWLDMALGLLPPGIQDE